MRILVALLVACFALYGVDAKGIRMKLRRRVEKKGPHPTAKKNNTLGPLMDVYGAQMSASHSNVIYEAQISLGTPFKTFSVIMDTGSTELWVPHIGCHNTGSLGVRCPDKEVYDESQSKSANNTNMPFTIKYGIGDTSGVYIEDYFAFGPAECPKKLLKLKERITFGAGDQTAQGDRGIMGLTYGGYGEKGTAIFERAVKEGLMDAPMFTILYKKCPAFQEDCKNAGMITFGEHDTKMCGPIIGYANINPNAIHWEFMLDALEVGSYTHPGPIKVITDTGASHMFLDQITHDNILRAMGAKPAGTSGRLFSVPCNKQGIDIKLKITGIVYTIPLEAITLKMNEEDCQIMMGVTKSDHWNLGDPWVRSYCHIHDWSKKRVGFAKPN